jgi:O-antigen/teichoic acid export membrane protein
MLRGTFWLAIKSPLQMGIALWSIPLTQKYIGEAANGAYVFAWGLGFVQFVLEFGMGSALQKQAADAYARGDRDGVNRAIACGMNFYSAVAFVQMIILLTIAYVILPQTKFAGDQLVLGLLWLQILVSPFFGLSNVVGTVLQAGRRYEIIPQFETLIVLFRFLLLLVGYFTKAPFLLIVAGQLAIQIGLSVIPALWVMTRELGFVPHFRGARRADYAALVHISFFMALIQVSVALADKIDTTILGLALPDADPRPGITVYQNVSKPFLQIRQTGWTLAYLVLPAVVSLAVGGDRSSLDRIKYDGSRLLIALLLPVTLLAGIYASPFLSLWVGPHFAPEAWMLRLFLVAVAPLVIVVLTQMAIGMGKIEVIAIAALVGSLVNLPLSYFLTRKLGVSGVIWGTVLTTLLSNLLVPGVYCFRLLEVKPAEFLYRTLGAPLTGGLALVVACFAFSRMVPPGPPVSSSMLERCAPFLANLAVGSVAYLLGYGILPPGRGDLGAVARKLTRRPAPAV